MYNVVFEKKNKSRFLHSFTTKVEYQNYHHPHQVIAEGVSFEAAETLCQRTPEIYSILDAIENSADSNGRLHELVLRRNVTNAILSITFSRLNGLVQDNLDRNVNIPLPPDKPRDDKEDLLYAVYSVTNLNTGQVDIDRLTHLVNHFIAKLQERHPPAI